MLRCTPAEISSTRGVRKGSICFSCVFILLQIPVPATLLLAHLYKTPGVLASPRFHSGQVSSNGINDTPMPLSLTTEVRMIKGVGPNRAELLAKRGIYTVG